MRDSFLIPPMTMSEKLIEKLSRFKSLTRSKARAAANAIAGIPNKSKSRAAAPASADIEDAVPTRAAPQPKSKAAAQDAAADDNDDELIELLSTLSEPERASARQDIVQTYRAEVRVCRCVHACVHAAVIIDCEFES
jgi:hypothetical protein